MPNKMLIDASHPEETRVVVVRGNRIEEFDFESQDKKQLKGNIYLARVTRVEPSLQAAFVEYGGNRHGFLAFSEIHPDYYQIPVADRQELLRAEAEAAAQADDDEDESEERNNRNGRRKRRGGRDRGRATDGSVSASDNGDESSDSEESVGADASIDVSENTDEDAPRAIAEAVSAETISEEIAIESSDEVEIEAKDNSKSDDDDSDDNGDNGDEEIVSVGAEDALEEIQERRRSPRKQYKIQEVIKRRQILLVQVVKEERGNKGAALTTYLSLAGRYSVLMPNTARGGGISRKITNVQDRKRLKEVVKELEVPQGMGVILRTAGENRTKVEIRRDYEYLMRLWENVRELTLTSSAPALVYEEGSLIKRSVRDLYNKDISEIQVSGEEAYREAKNFMRMLMPSHAKVVQPYRDSVPVFARNGIEGQLDKIFQPQVTLKSGGYLIINQTEALVSIDVNSGRSTKEHSIEDTALQTNLEAAEEVARQLRLRDLAGLIVIDFIDMEENRNNRAVEKRLKECLKNDRARIQVGRISHFGLLEMSRQRIRASVLESTMQPCPHCGGTGHVRSESSVALLVVRAIEEFLLKDSRSHIIVRTPMSTAIYVLNHKRANLIDLENRFGLTITVEADNSLHTQHYAIFKGAIAERPEGFVPFTPTLTYEEEVEDDIIDVVEEEEEEIEAIAEAKQPEENDGQGKRKRRRRRRGGRDREQSASTENVDAETKDAVSEQTDEDSDGAAQNQTASNDASADEPKKRRRGKRGGRRNRREENNDTVAAESASDSVTSDVVSDVPEVVTELKPATSVDDAARVAVETSGHDADFNSGAPEVVEVAEVADAAVEEPVEPAAKPKRKTTRRTTKKTAPAETEVSEAVATLDNPTEVAAEEAPAKPKAKRAPRRKKVAVEEITADAAVAETTAQEPVTSASEEVIVERVVETSAVAEEVTAPVAKSSEPVITSSGDSDSEDKPRKGGWWQRRGFF